MVVRGEENLYLSENFEYQPSLSFTLGLLMGQPIFKVIPFVNRPTGIYDKQVRTYVFISQSKRAEFSSFAVAANPKKMFTTPLLAIGSRNLFPGAMFWDLRPGYLVLHEKIHSTRLSAKPISGI